MVFQLKSSAFEPNQAIPLKYTCTGEDRSLPLSWTDPPPGTEEFALIMEDPDAPSGVWVHWVLYHIPPSVRALEEGIPEKEIVQGIGTQGVNDFGRIGYGGPCPPPGPAHRYLIRLYALNARVKLDPRATKQKLFEAIGAHIIAQAELVGRYG